MRVLITVLALLAACGGPPSYYDALMGNIVVDAELAPYLAMFREEGLKRGHDIQVSHISANFTTNLAKPNETDNTVQVGVCYSFSNGVRQIWIDKNRWDTYSDFKREALMMHETAHCATGRNHVPQSEWARSLMTEVMVDWAYNASTRDLMLDELFDPSSTVSIKGK